MNVHSDLRIDEVANLWGVAAQKKVSVRLTGMEWHCLLCLLQGRPLTDLGNQYASAAARSLQAQLERGSNV